MSIRFLELGVGCIVGAILNMLFGHWINVVLLLGGCLFLLFAFLEKFYTKDKNV